MVRRYEELIEVRATADGTAGGVPGAPDAFLWRGRLYVVREVLDHWKERRPWWREALDDRREPVAGARAESRATTSGRNQARATAVSRAAAPAAPAAPPATATSGAPDVLGGARERQVWRVEASPGRMAGSGVYDLGADLSLRQWRLLRVAD